MSWCELQLSTKHSLYYQKCCSLSASRSSPKYEEYDNSAFGNFTAICLSKFELEVLDNISAVALHQVCFNCND